jgi:hypothetical protein
VNCRPLPPALLSLGACSRKNNRRSGAHLYEACVRVRRGEARRGEKERERREARSVRGPSLMGALRERSTVTYEECHEDGCVILRNGFHSAQVS